VGGFNLSTTILESDVNMSDRGETVLKFDLSASHESRIFKQHKKSGCFRPLTVSFLSILAKYFQA
jgi:hypothetical protein